MPISDDKHGRLPRHARDRQNGKKKPIKSLFVAALSACGRGQGRGRQYRCQLGSNVGVGREQFDGAVGRAADLCRAASSMQRGLVPGPDPGTSHSVPLDQLLVLSLFAIPRQMI
jgi:hypothetical protein